MIVAADTQTSSSTRAGIVGGCVAVVIVWRTGLVSALPAAVGLTMLAASDWATRRVPRQIVVATAVAMLALAVLDAVRLNALDRLAIATVLAVVVGLTAGLAWYFTPGIAFGDVKLLALAAFVPAWLGASAVVTMIAVALLAALVAVGVERVRAGSISGHSTIAFGPPLLAGWLVGVLTA